MKRWLKRNARLSLFALAPLLFIPALAAPVQAGADASSTALASGSIQAASALPVAAPLKAFKAVYQAHFELGISITGQAIRQLKKTGNGQWQLSMKASAMIASIDESSQFAFDQQQIRPQQFHYLRKIFGKKKQTQQRFDWQQNTLTSSGDGPSGSVALEPQTLDKVSYQIQLWRDLKAGQQTLRYRVADNGRLKTYRFKRIGEEQISTPAGTFSTIKVARVRDEDNARKTYIWFAKTLDHVIVKLEQVETDGKTYRLLLKRLDAAEP